MRRIANANNLRQGQHGFTLIELMVALVLGLFLVGAVSLTYLQAASGTRFGALESQMNEEGALALELVRSQVRLAGYSGVRADGHRFLQQLPIRGCDGGFTSATESGAFDRLACNGGNGNDSIALSYQATALNAQMVGNPLLPANCANQGISPDAGASIADNRFFIAVDNNNDNAPTLYCRGSMGPAGLGGRAALIPNVESLQLRYAITRVPTVGEALPHQVTAIVTSSDLPGGNWARVAAVELCLVVRSARPAPRGGLSMAEVTRYLDCDRTERIANDGRLRRTFRTMIPLPNARPALPAPYANPAGTVTNPYAHLSGS